MEKYPEWTSCILWKFPGARQRPTPICTKEEALQIIGLLPGAAGKKYRLAAAQLVLKYLEAPEELAELAVNRMEQLGDTEALKRHAARMEGKVKRLLFTDTLKENEVTLPRQYGQITNEMTFDIVGKTATQIKLETGVKVARDAMEAFELQALAASESLAAALMTKNESKGFTQCRKDCRTASQSIKSVLDNN